MLGRIAALLGPIFAKEIIEIARRRRYYLTRALYGSVLLFVLFLVWQDNRWHLQQAGAGSLNAMARVAQELFHAVSAALMSGSSGPMSSADFGAGSGAGSVRASTTRVACVRSLDTGSR